MPVIAKDNYWDGYHKPAYYEDFTGELISVGCTIAYFTRVGSSQDVTVAIVKEFIFSDEKEWYSGKYPWRMRVQPVKSTDEYKDLDKPVTLSAFKCIIKLDPWYE